MARTTSIYTRVDPEIKEQSEKILKALGIPVTSAINLFLRQVVMQRGIPFDVKIPAHPFDMSKMTIDELDRELQKGLDDFETGKVYSSHEVREKLKGQAAL